MPDYTEYFDDLAEFPPTSHLLDPTSSSLSHSLREPGFRSRSPEYPPSPRRSKGQRILKRVRPSVKMVRFAGLSLVSSAAVFGLFHISSKAAIAAPVTGPINSEAVSGTASPFIVHNISAPDGSIHGSFIGLGATIQSLWVKDKDGEFRDVVLGYDNTTQYMEDLNYPRFGPIVGRYANRIKNSTFSLPPTFNLSLEAANTSDSQVYHVTPNENGGLDTLHGGTPGWDRRPFALINKTSNYLAFLLTDPSGDQGFPGTVVGKVEYELQDGARWKIKLSATADGETPILLSSHTYWNLDAYKDNGSAADHYLQMNAPRYVATDSILIPTGELPSVVGTALDFQKPQKIGARFNQTLGYCGAGCIGYDNALVYAKHEEDEPVLLMWSESSGIKLLVTTDQTSAQIYSCDGIYPKNATLSPIPRKASQGGPDVAYENHSCVVIEQQSPIDGINNPQWGYDQVYGPDRPYEWNALYKFSTV